MCNKYKKHNLLIAQASYKQMKGIKCIHKRDKVKMNTLGRVKSNLNGLQYKCDKNSITYENY